MNLVATSASTYLLYDQKFWKQLLTCIGKFSLEPPEGKDQLKQENYYKHRIMWFEEISYRVFLFMVGAQYII